ncbi:MAG: DUF3298 and DUF4163 domain-containing protein [Candidatus Bathyarchaeia archaeon]
MVRKLSKAKEWVLPVLLIVSLALFYTEAFTAKGTKVISPKVILKKLEKKTPKFQLMAEYPQIAGLKDIALQNKINILLKEKALSFLPKDLDRMEKEIEPWAGEGYPYYQNIFSKATYNKGNLMSFKITSESFWGGAHPAHEGLTLNIELTKGKLLGLKDFFPKSAYGKLSQLATKKVQSMDELRGYLLIEKVPIDDNTMFYIKEKEIVIYFPPAEITAYAAGEIEIPLSFLEIKNMLFPYARKLLRL